MSIFKRRISFIALIFYKLLTPKSVVTWMPETSCFRTPFGNQRVHGSQTLRNTAWQHFYPNFKLIRKKTSWKTSLPVRSEILGLFGNTLTTDHMNSLHNRDKSPHHIQRPLSAKPETFSGCYFAFSKSQWNFYHFQKTTSFIAQIF